MHTYKVYLVMSLTNAYTCVTQTLSKIENTKCLRAFKQSLLHHGGHHCSHFFFTID